jgi:hypothetical protein
MTMSLSAGNFPRNPLESLVNTNPVNKRKFQKISLGRNEKFIPVKSPWLQIKSKDSHGEAVRRTINQISYIPSLQSTSYQNELGNRDGVFKYLELYYTPAAPSITYPSGFPNDPWLIGSKTARMRYDVVPDKTNIRIATDFPDFSSCGTLPSINELLESSRQAATLPPPDIQVPENELNKTFYAFNLKNSSGAEGAISQSLNLQSDYNQGFHRAKKDFYTTPSEKSGITPSENFSSRSYGDENPSAIKYFDFDTDKKSLIEEWPQYSNSDRADKVTEPLSTRYPSYNRYKKAPLYMGYNPHLKRNDTIGEYTSAWHTTGRLATDRRIEPNKPLPSDVKPEDIKPLDFWKVKPYPLKRHFFEELFSKHQQNRFARTPYTDRKKSFSRFTAPYDVFKNR